MAVGDYGSGRIWVIQLRFPTRPASPGHRLLLAHTLMSFSLRLVCVAPWLGTWRQAILGGHFSRGCDRYAQCLLYKHLSSVAGVLRSISGDSTTILEESFCSTISWSGGCPRFSDNESGYFLLSGAAWSKHPSCAKNLSGCRA